MRKLKIILKSKLFLIILFLLFIFRISNIIIKPNKSIYNENDNNFICTVINITNNKLKLDCNETIYSELDNIENIEIGDILKINGTLSAYEENKNINIFNYKDYQNQNNVFYKLKINKYETIDKSKSIILNIKNIIYKRIKNLNSFPYLKSFLLGDKNEIENKYLDSYKYVGIIHLFSISGMHLSFLTDLINKIYTKNNNKRSILILSFLFFYYKLIESISILRSIIFFIVKFINKLLDLNINKIKIIIISILLILIIKPNSIYNIGFYYSIIISSVLSFSSSKFSKIKNRLTKMFLISLISFLLTIPLNLYTYYEINILTVIYNLIFIPLVSFILFPLSLITLLFPFIDNILFFIINIFENISLFLTNIDSSLIFMKPNIIVIILYYVIIFIILYKPKCFYLLLIALLIHYNYNYIDRSTYILMLNVGQGDSILIHSIDKNILIDTGGLQNGYDIANNITIPVLKSLGIRKIDNLIITHGDNDHIGEGINLVNNFKVDKVIFNCGDINNLEEELINNLKSKRINYYKCINKLTINSFNLYFLNTREYDTENDNSSVIYTEINNYKILLMGDAEFNKEKDIINKYNISNIDILKVGHHGSKTSSTKEFINKMNPKYSLISVGKHNRYGHPNKEVLDTLKNSIIYRTDLEGSIMIKIKNNELLIDTSA